MSHQSFLLLALQIFAAAVPVLLAITLHEAAHGYVARYFGDNTAEREGRITLNPLRHIDLVGTIILPLIIFLASRELLGGHGMLFGWAKPVPVNFGRLRRPKADMLWVAAAGPLANLFMMLVWALVYGVVTGVGGAGSVHHYLLAMAIIGLQINGVLMLLNLLPIPPLDGGRIVVSLLPNRLAWQFLRIEPFGMVIVIVLLLTGVLGAILRPPVQMLMMFVR
ncbi:peptidase M50 [Betaproteobacteria bacterium]|nr:peptidase M50 [Betaproteobacteria bacterium]GHT96242.1 peptidase M50 [Betaproteobacteria bacterium]GHT97480.1 peptidase M50 [Betaproteobacteria bacterium]GHU12702.1 peptidase M50 [Betaproteobacteria bacterium]GHU21211.1 peptidase M50 [Betaproteobacteria bacterium]